MASSVNVVGDIYQPVSAQWGSLKSVAVSLKSYLRLGGGKFESKLTAAGAERAQRVGCSLRNLCVLCASVVNDLIEATLFSN